MNQEIGQKCFSVYHFNSLNILDNVFVELMQIMKLYLVSPVRLVLNNYIIYFQQIFLYCIIYTHFI